VQALTVENRIRESTGLNRPVAEGATYPTITSEAMSAGELVQVLRHQMDAVRDDVLQAWEN
jgi:hypothetical protein